MVVTGNTGFVDSLPAVLQTDVVSYESFMKYCASGETFVERFWDLKDVS